MRKNRLISCMVSLALSVNISVGSLSISLPVSAENNVTADELTGISENEYVGTEHAYDPLAELKAAEKEKKFRETANISENKVVFSILDVRSDNKQGDYLNNNSDICCKYGLYGVSMVYETSAAEKDTYEVFYEAYTSSDDVWSVVDKLTEDESIVSAEPVFVWKKTATGAPVEVSEEEFDRAAHFKLLETEKVWKSLKNSSSPGKGAIVAVIDTGVDYNHKDLAANIWTNPGEKPNNGIDDDENGYVDDVHGINAIYHSGDSMDDHGHGTHVAGAITMTAGNGGGIGLAYGAQIMCIKAGRSDGTFASSDIAKAVKYAVDNGADIINMSFGGVEKSQVVESALNEAAESAVLVASAGNDGLPTSEANGYNSCMDSYPAGYSCVIGVMASDNYDRLASFSNWDYLSGKGCEYEMTAPGTDIYSTLPDNRYAVWSGTSLSASMVSAAAAIIRSEFSNKSKYNAKYITGQLINATKSRASAEPATVTVPVSTTSETATSVTTSTTTYVKSEDPLVNADVDGIEGITKDDFAYMLKGLVGINELSGSMGDVNCDGAADMFDAVSILRLCNNRDSLKDIMDSATISKEIIYFNIPSVNIEEDGSCTKYTFTYNANLPFKAITGQLKFNGKPYSGEFDDINLIESSSGEILYEFNPENGKFAAYSENNGTNGSFTISTYEGKDGSYAVDMNSLNFYDENGKEFLDFELLSFHPELTKKSAEAQNIATAAAVGNPTAVAVYDKKVEYPRLNIIDSLTVQPRPDLRIMDVVKFDSTDISKVNNGDGIIQPGETVGLGISIWNKWGAASDVNVKIEAVGADGKANPYVEVLDKTVSFGDIPSFSEADNGFARDSDGVKGVSKPIRIKVNDNAPNDGKMEFKLTVTAKNGFDLEDKEVYTVTDECSFIVQNIQYLRGKIKKDITLDRSRFWIIDEDVTLSRDVAMNIKPGAQVNINATLNAESGYFLCKGTEDNPIILSGSGNLRGGSKSKLYYTEISGIGFSLNYCDHCKFNIKDHSYNKSIDEASNSVFNGSPPTSAVMMVHAGIFCLKAYNCLFNYVDACVDHGNNTFTSYGEYNNNVVIVNPSEYKETIPFFHNRINNNAFLNNYNITPPSYQSITFSFKEIQNNEPEKYHAEAWDCMNLCGNCNYYGTDDPELIGIPKGAEKEYPGIEKSYLKLDSPEIEKIYPFMTEAYITDNYGERLDNVYLNQEVTLHIFFNRDMARDIQPQVTIGYPYRVDRFRNPDGSYYEVGEASYTYDNYAINGDWISAREWAGRFVYNGEGAYIRSEGAVAADDRWLVTGNDGGRFGFNVVKPATVQAITLKGTGKSGANQLTWSQDEMETLAGYNLYRSIDNEYFTKLNKTLLSNEELQYTDAEVITGQKYYYYFTSVDTDFKESSHSNTVECIPLDSEKPQITHTPVTYSEPEKAVIISANVTDNVKVDYVTLYYKYADEKEWNKISMKNPTGANYKHTFSSYEVKNGELMYYIETSDGINKSFFGTEKEPCIIEIMPVSQTTVAASTTSTTTTTMYNSGYSYTSTSTSIPQKENLILNGVGVSGVNMLNWSYNGNREILGYSLYRTEVINTAWYNTTANYKKLNDYIIPTNETKYTDKDVLRDHEYCYYVTVVYTNCNESAPSNIINCSPYDTLDNVCPTISNVHNSGVIPDIGITIFADIADDFGVKNAILYYRNRGDYSWNTLTMENTTDKTYSATIPLSKIRTGMIEYYIYAHDSRNTAEYGRRSVPKSLSIVVPLTETTTTTVTTTTTTTTTSTSTTVTSTTADVSTSQTTTTTTSPPLELPVNSIAVSNGEEYKIPLDRSDVSFVSDNTDVAVVSPDGTIKAVGAGEATITITDSRYNVVKLKVTVSAVEDYKLGDVDNNGIIDAVDASAVLAYYARISTNQDGGFTEKKKLTADVNRDGIIDAVDAAKILAYYAYASTTTSELKPMEEFLKK